MTAELNKDKLTSLSLTVVTPIGDIAIDSDKLSLGNENIPVINSPSKTDADFDETYALNYANEGKISLITKNSDYTTSEVVNLDYKLYVDFNIFEVLRNCLKNGEFDVTKLFDTEDSIIYFDLYHKCDADCGTFCNIRRIESRGSFLTLAYSPRDFDTNMQIAVNLQYLLPQGFLDKIAGSALEDTIFGTLIGEYFNLNLDLNALLANFLGKAPIEEKTDVNNASFASTMGGVLI